MDVVDQQPERIVDPSGGANQTRVRAYNERLVLSLVRRHGSLPKAEIAKRSGLSAQTVSVIMRSLERDGLLLRGSPQRGRVGQPSIPMSLDPDGVYSFGLKVGRRSMELILVDFLGQERSSQRMTYDYPLPEPILDFARKGLLELVGGLGVEQRARIAGIGVSLPFELWNWAKEVGAPTGEMEVWREFDIAAEISRFSGVPVFVRNDATAACGAELVFGRGAEFSDFVYFFVGTFVGGGIVLNHAVYPGRTGNAGALGSLPVLSPGGEPEQLIDHASIYSLESRLRKRGIDPSPLWLEPADWSRFNPELDEWIGSVARHLALAAVSACAVIDFEAAVVDGALPDDVRRKLVRKMVTELDGLDLQGISPPQVIEGQLGSRARAVGGASLPLFARYLLDQNVLFKETAQIQAF